MPRGGFINGNKIRILAVEDEAISALLLNAYLASQGYDCGEAAAIGEEAVERAARENPDIVFMDIQLAGKMDGIEAARLIKKNRENTQIVFVTAYSDEET
ncbi:MAG TPA: response regulator, partial [Candidatus Wallbacteria bacterium]|nr:response regulator [Candidatus Wallbacteria bacterium]